MLNNYSNKNYNISEIEENIKLLTNPIGLACFYIDDGTLVIDSVTVKIILFIFFQEYHYTL